MYCKCQAIVAALLLCGLAVALPVINTKDVGTDTSLDALPFDEFAAADGHFANMEVDGVEVPSPKKAEKLPGQKRVKSVFDDKPIGVAPHFTGSFINVDSAADTPAASSESESDVDYFSSSSDTQGPVTNPAATYLEGGEFENMPAPKCQMLGCTGPVPNDGSYATLSSALEGKACHQTFVALNGCVDNKGYPMGMLCSICCDCSNDFVAQMKKTFGFKKGFSP